MPSASPRVRTPRHKTERLDLQVLPQRVDEDSPVATVRILKVGSKTAARSGSTWQIPGPVQPGQPIPEPPRVIYARPVRSAPPEYYDAPADFVHDQHSAFGTPSQRIADLPMRAARAFSGLSANMPTQRIEAGKTWSKPSTRVMCLAVAIYTIALFLFALLGR